MKYFVAFNYVWTTNENWSTDKHVQNYDYIL